MPLPPRQQLALPTACFDRLLPLFDDCSEPLSFGASPMLLRFICSPYSPCRRSKVAPEKGGDGDAPSLSPRGEPSLDGVRGWPSASSSSTLADVPGANGEGEKISNDGDCA